MAKRKKTIRKAKVKDKSAATDRRFIEIVNWNKAQCMSKGNVPWMKLYTSLLDNDAFGFLDDPSRMLIIGLWLYAARMGHDVFRADPRWLRRKIPMLNRDPDLDPLLEAADDRGCPTPFLRYCGPLGTGQPSEPAPPAEAKPAGQEKATEKREGKGIEDHKPSEPIETSKLDQGQAQAACAVQPAPGLSDRPQPDRRLIKLIQRNGGSGTVRDVMRSTRMFPDAAAAEQALDRLVEAGCGQWETIPCGPDGGHPTRRFVLSAAVDTTADTTVDTTVDTTPKIPDCSVVSGVLAAPSRACAQGEERRGEKSRGEQTGDGREEQRREEKRREEKRRAEQRRAEQSRAETGEKTASQSTADQKTSEPADPPKPDQGQAQAACAVQPAPGLSSRPQPDRGRRSLSSAGEYDIHDLAVGRRVHRALHLLSDPDEGDGYTEVCSFASVLHGIMQLHARSPPEFRDRLGMRLLKLAGKIAKSKAARNKSRVWISKAREIAASDKWTQTPV